MRTYPKGCRYIRAYWDGVVEQRMKVTKQCHISDLTRYTPGIVVVQPRGKQKWYCFVTDGRGYPRLADTGHDPDVLLMKAMLLGAN